MSGSSPPLDLEEWDQTIGKMHRLHDNVQQEVAHIIQTIRKDMKQELIPQAEDRANFGKHIKSIIREMWSLEYEIAEIQAKFNESCLAQLDINSLTDDIVEDIMLQSKPLQVILLEIRGRQRVKCGSVLKEFGEHLKALEPLKITRPLKPEIAAAEKVEASPAIETAPLTSVSA